MPSLATKGAGQLLLQVPSCKTESSAHAIQLSVVVSHVLQTLSQGSHKLMFAAGIVISFGQSLGSVKQFPS